MKKNSMMFLVPLSPWPLISSINTNMIFLSTSIMLKFNHNKSLMLNLLVTSYSSILWWNIMKRENSIMGNHSKTMINLFKMGLILFIASEICLFSSMFWNFMHNAWSPNVEVGNVWPPHLMNINNPFLLPIFGTCALLSSGVFVTFSHHYLNMNMKKKAFKNLLKTVFLGILFLDMQMSEYSFSSFSLMAFNDSSFSSIFFMITGLHGSHVLIGILFLMFPLFFFSQNSISTENHNSFSLSVWYWHFVDVIWLFVYYLIYYINA